jgi:ketosteroid isomerase-like protein
MPDADLDVFRRALDAFNRRDFAAWEAECDPEFTDVPPSNWPENEPTHGRGPVWRFLDEATELWGHPTFEYSEVTMVGNRVVALVTSEVRGRASGATVPWRYWAVVSFGDGKALQIEWYADRAEAVRAASCAD